MKLKNYTKEDLETMSYDDIALLVLTESNKKLKINELFKEVCNLLELSENEYTSKLPAFFDVISTDGRFLMLENGYWDLKSKHSTKVVIDNDDEEEVEAEELDVIEEEEDEEDKDIYSEEDETEDLEEDDLKDLVIIDEDEETNGI